MARNNEGLCRTLWGFLRNRNVTGVVAWFSYCLGLSQIFYFLNRRRKRILTFHNVLPDELFRPTLANGVSCSVSTFEMSLDEVGKHFGFSTGLGDPENVTITFDDGYVNQVEVVGAILDARNIPAYLFVSGRLIDSQDPEGALVVDLLTHWISEVPDGDYTAEVGGQHYDLQIHGDNRAQVWTTVLWPLFLQDASQGGRTLLEALDRCYPMGQVIAKLPSDYARLRLQGVTDAQLDDRRAHGWRIGWHTMSHFPLKYLDEKSKMRELEASREFREEIFSFPYGEEGSVSEADICAVQKLGYPAAVSNINTQTGLRGRHFLPRMGLTTHSVPELHFELSGLKYFLKHRRLLPKTEV